MKTTLVICANTIICPNVKIGDHVHINIGCTLGYNAILNDFVTLAPNVNITDSDVLKTGVYMGVGSSVIQYKQIGEWSTIGAGGVVIKDIPANVTAVGVPYSLLIIH